LKKIKKGGSVESVLVILKTPSLSDELKDKDERQKTRAFEPQRTGRTAEDKENSKN
jgi:hypothetical protein